MPSCAYPASPSRGSTTLFQSNRSYDAVGNLTSVGTTLPGGTDNLAFCYDEQNRLTWASSQSGSMPCGGTLTAGSLGGSALYTSSYAYDGGNRLSTLSATVGPTNTPLHSYSYAYNGDGDRTSIVEDSAPTTYTYDGDNQLLSAANSSGTTTYAYDAHHNRTSMTTTTGTTTYTYDPAGVLLVSKTDTVSCRTVVERGHGTTHLACTAPDHRGARRQLPEHKRSGGA